MGVCDKLEPQRVFHYFEEICGIPHGSGNTKAISDYCVDFAKGHHLKWLQDENGNVILFKEGSRGYEGSAPVIIQGHMDMVCEKESGIGFDFEKDGLDLYVEGDFLRARGTTLGGDDGIALAYAFALLEDDTLPHPPLEVVFTVDEEIGLLGAEQVDLSMLKGKKLLNLDSDEEGIFFASCAGGLQMECKVPVERTQREGNLYEVKVSGLQGGHSGADIHRERGNAIFLMGRALEALGKEIPYAIVSLQGGTKDNAIPWEASCVILLDHDFYAGVAGKENMQELAGRSPSQGRKLPIQDVERRLQEKIERLGREWKQEYHRSDPGVTISCQGIGTGRREALADAAQAKVLFFLRTMPWGVQHWSMDIEGLVETSLNPGIMVLEDQAFSICAFIRSSLTSRKYEVAGRLVFLTEFLGGEVSASGDYPAWEYQADSPMRELLAGLYREMFQKEPQIKAIHAGLECGIFSGKIQGLDCISFGPDNFDIHTTKEHLSISSTERVWKLLLEFLKRSR